MRSDKMILLNPVCGGGPDVSRASSDGFPLMWDMTFTNLLQVYLPISCGIVKNTCLTIAKVI